MRTAEGKKLLTSREVAGILRVSIRRLQDWDRQGIVDSSKAGARRKRLYGFMDLVQIKLVLRLRDEGVPLQRIKMAAARFRRDSGLPLAPLVKLCLVTDGRGIYVIERGAAVWNAVDGRLAIVPIEEIIEETSKIVAFSESKDRLTIKDVFHRGKPQPK